MTHGAHENRGNRRSDEAALSARLQRQTHGAAALDRMATESPALYCRMMASLIPAHFKVEHEHMVLLSEDDLRARLLEVRRKLIDLDVDPELLGPPPDGSQSSADGPRPVVKLPARRNRKTPSIN